MKSIYRFRLSLKVVLLFISILCLLFAGTKWQYDIDQSRVRNLGPTFHTASIDEPWVWMLPPHVFGAYRWNGPEWLEQPMRTMGIPWFDRIEIVIILNDDRMTPHLAAELAGSMYLKKVEIRNSSQPRETYAELIEKAGNRVDIVFTDR